MTGGRLASQSGPLLFDLTTVDTTLMYYRADWYWSSSANISRVPDCVALSTEVRSSAGVSFLESLIKWLYLPMSDAAYLLAVAEVEGKS